MAGDRVSERLFSSNSSHAFAQSAVHHCVLQTSLCKSMEELSGSEVPELRYSPRNAAKYKM